MKYLIDTCVISELVKSEPDKKVINWISNISEDLLFLSVFTIGEIRKGIEKLSESKKKRELQHWLKNDLRNRFSKRILNFDINVSEKWGEIQGQTESQGKTLSLIDGLIASTAIYYDMVLVTRNVKDVENSGAVILNPWED